MTTLLSWLITPIALVGACACQSGDQVLSVGELVDPDRPLDLYEAKSCNLLITVDLMAFATARTLGRTLDSWERVQEPRMRRMAASLSTTTGATEMAEWARVTGRCANALLSGWPDVPQDLSKKDVLVLRAWRESDYTSSSSFAAGTPGVGTTDALHLTAIDMAKKWLLSRCKMFSAEPPGVTETYLSEYLSGHADVRDWLGKTGKTLDMLMGGSVSGGAKASLGVVRNALASRETSEMALLRSLDPYLCRDRTYCGGLDVLAVQPLAGNDGRAFWKKLERSSSARQRAELGDGHWQPTSAYDLYLEAMSHLGRDAAGWTRGHRFVTDRQWSLRILQSRMAGWVCLRKNLARFTALHVIGGRESRVPAIIVDPFPAVFAGLARAVEATENGLKEDLAGSPELQDLIELRNYLRMLAEVAEAGPDGAARKQAELQIIGEVARLYCGDSPIMGGDEVVLARDDGTSGTLTVGLGRPRRMVIAMNVGSELVSYEGVIMSYREHWNGKPVVSNPEWLDLSGEQYDWGSLTGR